MALSGELDLVGVMDLPQDRLYNEYFAYCSHLAKNTNLDISCTLKF